MLRKLYSLFTIIITMGCYTMDNNYDSSIGYSSKIYGTTTEINNYQIKQQCEQINFINNEIKYGKIVNIILGIMAIPCLYAAHVSNNDDIQIFGFAGFVMFTLLSITADW